MLVEGNTIPGNPFTGDELPIPKFCPVCGGDRLEDFYWTTVEGDRKYPSLVCYGNKRFWFSRPAANTGWTSPYNGAHYQYKLPSVPLTPREKGARFDRATGKTL